MEEERRGVVRGVPEEKRRGARVSAVQRISVDEEGRLPGHDHRRVLQRSHAPARLEVVEVLADQGIRRPEREVVDRGLRQERRDEPGEPGQDVAPPQVAEERRTQQPDADDRRGDDDVGGPHRGGAGGGEERQERAPRGGAAGSLAGLAPREGDGGQDERRGEQVGQGLGGLDEGHGIQSRDRVGGHRDPGPAQHRGDPARGERRDGEPHRELRHEQDQPELLRRERPPAGHERGEQRVAVGPGVRRPVGDPAGAHHDRQDVVAHRVVDEGRISGRKPRARDRTGGDRGPGDPAARSSHFVSFRSNDSGARPPSRPRARGASRPRRSAGPPRTRPGTRGASGSASPGRTRRTRRGSRTTA